MEKMDLLLLLQNGPQEKGKIIKKLEVSPQKLSPQLVKLT
jgi:predicted transcriptional regulator